MNKWLKQIKMKAILPAAALLSAAAIGTTFAWQQWDMGMQNRLKADTTFVKVEEDFYPKADIKKAQFRNTGSSSVFIRVSYTDYWEMVAEDGRNYVLSGMNGNGERYALPNIPETDGERLWTDGGDGWYYYNRVLKAGEATELFVNGVWFAPKAASGVGPTIPGLEPQPTPPSEGLAASRPDDYETDFYHLFLKAEVVQCSDGSGTLNSEEVNKHATDEVFGKSATVGEPDVNGRAVVTWGPSPYLPESSGQTDASGQNGAGLSDTSDES